MKKCPFCAEAIQDAALVCKHYGRDLTRPAQPATTQAANTPPAAAPVIKKGLGCFPLLLVGIVAFFVLAFIIGSFKQQTDSSGKPILAISAGRGVTGIVITNREGQTLTHCDATLLDAGNSEWLAGIAQPIAPSETVSVVWSEFKQNGQPLPGYIGRERDNVIISCLVGDNDRRSAGVHF